MAAQGAAQASTAARRAFLARRRAHREAVRRSQDKARAAVIRRLLPSEPVEIQAAVHRKDVVFKVVAPWVDRPERGDPAPRGAITRFSESSRRRLQFVVRNTADLWEGFLTLTYPVDFPADGRVVKRHLNSFCQWLRRHKVAYLWILEFQERGAPHFHFLIRGWIPRDLWEIGGRRVSPGTPGAVLVKKGLESTWAGIVDSWCYDAHVKAGTRVEAVKNPDHVGGYMAAYMGKLEQKQVPKKFRSVGRFWGGSRILEKTFLQARGLYADCSRALRQCRKFYASRCRGWGFKWRWKGHGFILIGGASLFKTLVRQAVLADNGLEIFGDWDGRPADRGKYVRPEEVGQFNLDGSPDADYFQRED